MSILTMLDKLILGPLLLLFDAIMSISSRYLTYNIGILLAIMSVSINLLVLPLYRRADALQEEERRQSMALKPGIDHIKRTFRGTERFMMLQTYYRQNGYKPWFALKGSLSLMLQIPFFIAAYRYLSGLQVVQGHPYGPIADVGAPDGLLRVAGLTINLLPLLMTAINIVSGAIYTRGMPLKSKVQLYGMAGIFLVLLYDSPAVLVMYWTMNNLFSLVKNIFYKLKDPRRVLAVLCSALGMGVLALMLGKMGRLSVAKKAAHLLIFLALQLPLVASLLRKRLPRRPSRDETRGDRALFFACCAFLTLLLGALIPLDVLRSSPQEFIDITAYHSSLDYVVSSLLLAAGTFLVWLSIFYFLSGRGTRRWYALGAAALSVIAVIDYTCYGGGYGTMSADLQYESRLILGPRQYLANLAVLAAAVGVVWLIWAKRQSLLRVVALAACAAVLGMSAMGAVTVERSNRQLIGSVDAGKVTQQAVLPLDKSGRNVIVIMLDRGLGRFVPYLMQEKPELLDSFAGFTLYTNVISYGSHTNVGSPALFGGYEYTPLEMNRRSDELLVKKHNEALSVMPALFLENGFEVTVCDPPYANYCELPDLSIYDQWPGVNAYITMNSHAIDDPLLAGIGDESRYRNFFPYSLFRAAPLLLHKSLYNGGLYNQTDVVWAQSNNGVSRARGVSRSFVKDYGALKKLTDCTRILDEGKNTFLMLNNETTHAETLLQEPDYVPALTVDNTDYDREHAIRCSIGGEALRLTTLSQMQHYQINMAAMLQLGKWLDYLRENGIYDNTRIILVSDHGYRIGELFGLKAGKDQDMFCFCPLLMVKDFGSDEGFTIDDDTFMTNADTPLLALDGLVEAPVNPFTGRLLSDEAKQAPEQLVAFEHSIRPSVNNGTRFEKLDWYANRNNAADLSAWRPVGETPEG